MSAERPQREVAYRLFAAEFDDATHTYAESEEERAPNYVVAPSGARINRVFIVGVLTEVEQVSDDVVRARIVDPTGAFVVYAGQYQPEALAFFERTDPPAFVAVTGKARTFEPEDGDVIYTSIRPETANEVDADTRDRWVVQTAEHTLERVGAFAEATEMAERGDALETALLERGLRPGLAAGIPRAIDVYGTTPGYLSELRRLATDAARVVAGDLDEVESRSLAPGDGADESLSIAPAFREAAFHDVDAASETRAGADRTPKGAAEEAKDDGPGDEGTAGDDQGLGALPDEDEPDETEPDETVPDEDETGQTASDETGQSEESEGTLPDDEEMYELSEAEREAVEEKFDVGFETGNEVDSPGATEIESTPSADDGSEGPAGTRSKGDTAPESDVSTGPSAAERDSTEGVTPGEDGTGSDEPDLEDAVVDVMLDLDDGSGVPRDAIVERVTAERGVDESAVEDAIQDALMGGRCYESGDDRLTPI